MARIKKAAQPRQRVMKGIPETGEWSPSELDTKVGDLHSGREEAIRVRLVGKADDGGPVATSNVMQGVDEAERRFHLAGAIEPPYNPTTLAALIEHSNALRPNIDAYATNIDGFGHKFEPVIDLDGEDADDKIAQAITIERERLRADPSASPDVMNLPLVPRPDEVAAKKAELVQMMRAEKVKLDFFFENCVDDMSFVSMRRKLRQDLENIGNAYFEVLRNGRGEIASFVYIPSFTMRLLPLDKTLTDIQVKQRVSAIDYASVPRKKQFRKFVQVFEAYATYFKEFGDPRIISKKSGKVYASQADLVAADPSDGPATEIIHLKVHSSRTAYGVPRWIGNLLSVLGSRQAEEINYLYFENKAVPPLALLVNGGRLTDETVTRVEDHIKATIKGKKNFHSILILEAVGEGGTVSNPAGKMEMKFERLADQTNKDALFQQYDSANIDKIGMSFRLPKMLRGDIKDFNRATADAALEFAEQQVFAPERSEFDFIVNRKILVDMGVRFWKFASLTPTVKDSEKLAGIIRDLVTCGVLTPEEARELCNDVFNKELPRLDAEWVKQPLELTLAGLAPGAAQSTPWTGEDDDFLGPHDPYDKSQRQPPHITATAMGNVITVNEARSAHGLQPWTDGNGELTISAYAEKVRQQMMAKDSTGAGGDGMGDAIAGPPPTDASGTLHINDLTGGGQLAAAQGTRPRRRRGTRLDQAAVKARQLLAIRDALAEAEGEVAQTDFMLMKRLDLPPAAIRRIVPRELVAGQDDGDE